MKHHLQFTLGTVLEWIDADRPVALSPSLPSHIHYGVPNQAAIELMGRGVRSRRLAILVGERASAQHVVPTHLGRWLTRLGVSAWQTEFGAGPAEVSDLLQYVHDPAAETSALLLDGQTVRVPIESTGAAWGPTFELPIAPESGERSAPLVLVNSAGEVVGWIRASHHRHLSLLLEAGFRLKASALITDAEDANTVAVSSDDD